MQILLALTSVYFFKTRYYTAYEGWDITCYQDLFYPSTKASCNQLVRGIQLVKTGG